MTTQLALHLDATPVDTLAEHRATIRAAILADALDHGGAISANRVRAALRDKDVPPRLVGQEYRRLVRDGLIARSGHEVSDDHRGGNGGRMIPAYRMTGSPQ